MMDKPVRRQLLDELERARLFKEVRGAGNDFQFRFAAPSSTRLLVQIDDDIVPAADDD